MELERRKAALYMNIPLIQAFCQEWEMPFSETLDVLEMIHAELDGRHNPNRQEYQG